MADLKALYRWFDEHRESIINAHPEECVLLKDNTVIGYYPNTDAALSDAEKKSFVMGEFLIQDCISSEADTIMFYNWGVSFG
jgi:hypothetical protein